MPEFDDKSAQRIAETVRWAESNMRKENQVPEYLIDNGGLNTYLVSTPADGIPGRSGNVCGQAECEVVEINPDTQEIQTISENEIVLNLSETPVIGEAYILCSVDQSGNLIAVPRNNGLLIRVSFSETFTKTTASVNCVVQKADSPKWEVGQTLTADNSINLESDLGKAGFVWEWADGTHEILNAECPEEA